MTIAEARRAYARARMTFHVPLTVTVDCDAWRAEYGTMTETAGEIREAIRWTLVDAARAAYAHIPTVIVDGPMLPRPRKIAP